MLAAPLLSPAGLFRGKVHWSDPRPPSVVPPAEHELMVDHAALGCICFWCEDAGAVHPFVMAKRPFKAGIPVAQVVYCPPGIDWRRLSGAVGRAMARHRLFLLLIDAAGPIPACRDTSSQDGCRNTGAARSRPSSATSATRKPR